MAVAARDQKPFKPILRQTFQFFFVFAAGRSSEVVRLGAPRRLGALLFFPLTARASAAPGFSNPSNRLERPLGYGQSRLLSLTIGTTASTTEPSHIPNSPVPQAVVLLVCLLASTDLQ